MTQRDTITRSREHMKAVVEAMREQMRSIQEGPPGTVPRSPRERKNLWRKLKSLEKPELQGIMEAMAERAGHTADEERPCELCRFLIEQMDAPK